MLRAVAGCLSAVLVLGFAAGLQADEAVPPAMPRPLDFLRVDYAALQADGFFTVVDIRYERRYGFANRPAFVLTLRVDRPLSATEADELLRDLQDVRFIKEVRETEVLVRETTFFTPDHINFAFVQGDEPLEPGEGIEIHVYLDAGQIRDLQQQGATDVVIGG